MKTETKFFGGEADGWGWARRLDVDHEKYPAEYRLVPGEDYILTISGRSKNFNFDRIVLFHESRSLKEVQRMTPGESRTLEELEKGPEEVVLTNTEGVEIRAQLLGLKEGKLTLSVDGQRFEIGVKTLRADDRKLVRRYFRERN